MIASLLTLDETRRRCPDNAWNESYGGQFYCGALFHTLICADLYMSDSMEEFYAQKFHKDNTALFKDYEEMDDRPAKNLYTRDEIALYLEFCINKTRYFYGNIEDAALTLPSIREKCGYEKKMNCAEMAIYNTRHIQHHAAQLGLVLQEAGLDALKWVCNGSSSAMNC